MSTLVRVLVVDDEPAFREGLKVALTAEGFEVTLAEDGEETEDTLRLDETTSFRHRKITSLVRPGWLDW